MITVVAILLAVFVLPRPWGLVAVAVAATIDTAQTFAYARWSQRRRAGVGAETLVGKTGTAVTALAPRGQVRVGGELWRAASEEPVDPGDHVVVRGVDGLTLEVERAP